MGFFVLIIPFIHFNLSSMKSISDGHFMQVAMFGLPCQMTNEELLAEFENFQHDVRNLLTSDKGYLTIDFLLNDTLALFESVTHSKKK